MSSSRLFYPLVYVKQDALGSTGMVISTTDHRLYLRAASVSEMRRWLFCFQRSVALVLTHLLSQKGSNHQPLFPTSRKSGSAQGEDDEDAHLWLCELGFGHGRHSLMLQRRSSIQGTSVNADLKEEFSSRQPGGDPIFPSSGSTVSAVDLTQLYSRQSGQVLQGGIASSSGTGSGLSQSLSAAGGAGLFMRPGARQNIKLPPQLNGKLQSIAVKANPATYHAAVPPKDPSAAHGSEAIPIHATPQHAQRRISADGSTHSLGGAGERKLAGSYDRRHDSKTLLNDELVDLRLRLLSQSSVAGDDPDDDDDENIKREDSAEMAEHRRSQEAGDR